jgi:hypothetical protein
VTSKSGGTATQVFLDSGADAVFANPLSGRADAGFTVRRVPRGSSAPFDGRVAAGNGTERGADAAQIRKAEAVASEAKGPLVGEAGAGAVRAPMDAAGAVGVALVMRPESPEHARAEEREQVAAAKVANAPSADQQHAATVVASEPKVAASQTAAVRTEAHPAESEADGHGRTADPAVASDTRAAGHSKGEGSPSGPRGEAHEVAAPGDRVEESRVGDAPEAAVVMAKRLVESDDAGGQGHAKPIAADGARTKDVPAVESKADAGRGTMDTTDPGKIKGAPPVDDVKSGPDHSQSATTEHAPAKDASLLIGATTIVDQSASHATPTAGKAAAKGTAVADTSHAQTTSVAADPVKIAATVSAAQPVKSGPSATDGHDQAVNATTGVVETQGHPAKAAAATPADVSSHAAKAAPAVDPHDQAEKPAASAVGAPAKAVAAGTDASGQAAKIAAGATDATPQASKAATVAADLHGQTDKAATPAVDTATKASAAADTHGQLGTAAKSLAADTGTDTHGQPVKAAAAVGTHDAAAAVGPAPASDTHGQDKAATTLAADDHSHPAVTAPADVSHVQTASAASAAATVHAQTAEAASAVAHTQPVEAAPVVAHAQAGEAAPVVAHTQPVEAAPVVTHAQPGEAAPVVAHALPVVAAPVVAHTQPGEAAPVVAHAVPVEAAPVQEHAAVVDPAPSSPAAEGAIAAAVATPDMGLHFPDLWTSAGATTSVQPIVLSPDPVVGAAPAGLDHIAAVGTDATTGIVRVDPAAVSIVDSGTTHSLEHPLLQFASITPQGPVLASDHLLDGSGSAFHPADPIPLFHPTNDAPLL